MLSHHPLYNNRQIRTVFSLLFALLLVAALHHPATGQSATGTAVGSTQLSPTQLSPERIERLGHFFDEYVEQERLAGGVIWVSKGESVYHHAFGDRDREAGDPMETGDIFRIASQTKALISTGIMMLQEEGRLLISDPVSRYLPEFSNLKVAVPAEGDTGGDSYTLEDARRPVTLRHLLTHTSGFDYGYGVASDLWEEAGLQGWYFADREEPIRESVARMAELPLQHHPGEKYTYGYSTDILGVVIEEVTGESLESWLQRNLLDPLQMTDTHFYLPQSKADRLAVVYSVTDERSIERAPDPGGSVGQGHYLNGPRTSFSGGAGLVSTASDYARFLQMLLNGGELDGVRILSPKTVELMTADHLVDIPYRNGQGFGLGFSTVEDVGARGVPGSVGEYGWGGAYHSTYWVDPSEELVVVFLTQLIPATGSDIHGKVRALIYQAIVN